ncbi:LysR family transcriptional regulator [Luteibacter yeojuensis]|uniref:HTH lysR-type domain-containing protein n=1 Tax=Luteibacter yeojuensis TaxID=345309 RepID=A0A0F3KXM1_9GAMM|nr:LysR family transcriptional regulator [Luteibacter yeojuensis]KJV35692.1 hypothetical protein VI08_06715 [Luteibacter yeojuensis]
MDLIAALRSFVRVAQTGSFSAVATERGVTQPAISRQVSALEDYLGARLVHRSTQAVTLTEEGRELLLPAQRLIDDAEDLPFNVGARRGRPAGRVRIALPVPLGLYLSSHLAPFLASYEGISVDLVLRDGVSNLIEEGLDCEIRLGPLEDSTLVARTIGQTKAYLVASPGYLEQHQPPAHPRDLEQHDCIFYQRWGRENVWWFSTPPAPGDVAGQDLAISVSGRIHSNNAGAVYRAALAGQGIALLSHLLVAEDLAAGRLLHVMPDYPTRRFPIHVVYPSKRSLPPRTRALIDYISGLLEDDPDMAMDAASPVRR